MKIQEHNNNSLKSESYKAHTTLLFYYKKYKYFYVSPSTFFIITFFKGKQDILQIFSRKICNKYL